MNEHTPSIRASHVNRGTSFVGLSANGSRRLGPVLRHPTLQLSSEPSDTTPYGGLALAVGLVRSLDVARDLDRELSLLASYRPFHESDHVLTHVYNLYAGGTCIEDIADLQTSEPVRRILGADRIPDPTTAGDFLAPIRRRRTGSAGSGDRPGSGEGLEAALRQEEGGACHRGPR